MRFDPFRPHLGIGFFELVSDEKNETRERCVESLTKRKTFPIIHPPPMEITAKNTIGLSIKKVTFTSVERKNRHLSYNFTLFHFFFLTHKDHTKTFTMSQKSKFMQYICFFVTQNSESEPRGLYFSKALFEGLIFGGAYIRKGLCTGGNFRFEIDWASL